jgi:hypothetical protein
MAAKTSFQVNGHKPLFGATLMAGTLLLTLSGCRFGNRIERADTSAASQDPISGYYATQAQSVTFCAESATTECGQASASEIPTFIRATMTNPVILYLSDSDGSGLLLANDGSDYGIATTFKSLSEIEHVSQSDAETLWLDPACTRTAILQEVGSFSANSSKRTMSDPGSLSLTFTYYEMFDGDCTATFTQLQACMNDATQCSETPGSPSETLEELAELQETVSNFFGPYLESGALNASDIPQLKTFAFEVTYQ